MSEDPIDLDEISDRLSLDNPGPGDYERMMKVLTRVVEVVADDLPPVGRAALDAARRRWVERHPEATPLVDHRVACWRYLDDKNGNSTTIADREDHAVRAVIALLFESSDDDLYETAAFTLDMAAALGVQGSQVESIIDDL